LAKNNSSHYIDNKEFFLAMSEWKLLVIEAGDLGDPRPPVTEYIGECFLKIAEHLAFKPNFMNYVYKEEMIGDGIENCLMYAHNFDPEKSKNPFSYFTQIIYYAFLRRIEKEKKQNYIKFKSIVEKDKDGILRDYYNTNYFEDETVKVEDQIIRGYFNLSENDVKKFEPKKKVKKKKKTPLDDVLKNKKEK
jgi:hypothetical protein